MEGKFPLNSERLSNSRRLLLVALITLGLVLSSAYATTTYATAHTREVTYVFQIQVSQTDSSKGRSVSWHLIGFHTDQLPLTSGTSTSGYLLGTGDADYYYIDVGSGAISIHSTLTCPTYSDFDLYAGFGYEPSHLSYTWHSAAVGPEDYTYNNPAAGTWYIEVYSYSGYGSYTLTVTVNYGLSMTMILLILVAIVAIVVVVVVIVVVIHSSSKRKSYGAPSARAYAVRPAQTEVSAKPEASKTAAGVCPSCGATNSPTAKFCKQCGSAL
jgi:ribosomal protein L40E